MVAAVSRSPWVRRAGRWEDGLGARPVSARGTPGISHCRVDAGGIPAEWVEVTTATTTQPTVVYFVGHRSGGAALETTRAQAGRLAGSIGARVLTVACGAPARDSRSNETQRGLAAYLWLLGEGCDPGRTVFVSDPSDAGLLRTVLLAARRRGVPLPGGLIELSS